MAKLKFNHVNKIYSNNVQAVFDFNLDIDDREFIVFVGPSGCGKSTTLRMVAGLEEISSGEIYIDDVLVNDAPPKDRNISMVFQNYALYPHMTVFDNMAFSLQLRKELFPVYEIKDKEAYDKEAEEIEAEYELKQKEGVAALKTKKAIKEEIKDFVYRNKLTKEMKIAEVREKYKVRVMTYDHDKVEELNKEQKEIYASFENKQNELERVSNVKLEEGLARLKAQEATKEELKEFSNKAKAEFDSATAKLDEECEKAVGEIKEKISKIKSTLDKPAFEYRRYSKSEITEKVVSVSRTIGLEQYLKRKPGALSGGQRQRVALGRAIVRNPKVFLMDEPLSNLDAKLRVQMRTEIAKIYQNLGVTVIYVTHDQTEAMTMATRIVCMKDGYIQQIGTPRELFNDPANMFVAGFIGSPSMNFVSGIFDGKYFVFDGCDVKIQLTKEQASLLKEYKDKELIMGVRPENVLFENDKTRERLSNSFELTCDLSELLGHELIIYNYAGDTKIVVKSSMVDDMRNGDVRKYAVDLDRVFFFDKESTLRIK